MSFTDPKGTVGGGRWMPWKNTSGATIPAWAVIQITDTDVKEGTLYWKCETPGADANVANVAFNGPTEVAANAFGVCTYDAPSRVLYEYPPDVAVGDTVGPKNGQYTISKDGTGFEVLGDIDTTNKWCHVGKSGGSGAPRIRFTILSADFTVGYGALGCDHVIGLVNHVSCKGASVAVGDEVKIYDPEYCYFNLPIELLVGLSGTATLMSADNYQPGLDYLLDCLEEVRTAGCIWMIDTLCCSEEESIGG